jgi:hypothetical protein
MPLRGRNDGLRVLRVCMNWGFAFPTNTFNGLGGVIPTINTINTVIHTKGYCCMNVLIYL